jgi:hypothetical protein
VFTVSTVVGLLLVDTGACSAGLVATGAELSLLPDVEVESEEHAVAQNSNVAAARYFKAFIIIAVN